MDGLDLAEYFTVMFLLLKALDLCFGAGSPPFWELLFPLLSAAF